MHATKRPVNEGAERHMYVTYPVLDQGFVMLVDYMGDEAKIDRNARVSHASEARTEADRVRLLRYLYRHGHHQPLEFAELEFHCRLPIFVARQWVRHRTASLCEQSGRYTLLPPDFYRPSEWRAKKEGAKLGSEGVVIDPRLDTEYEMSCRRAFNVRHTLDAAGVDRELSRLSIPLSTFTEWVWKIDLRNLLHFLTLREDSHAQAEIRAYARIMAGIVRDAFPSVYAAWIDYEVMGARFSRQEMTAIQTLLLGREWPAGLLRDETAAKLRCDYTATPDHTVPRPKVRVE